MITIYAPDATDFSDFGLGILDPYTCTVREMAGGQYDLTMEHPIDEALRWTLIAPECIIKAPAPLRESPIYEAEAYSAASGTVVPVTRMLCRVKSGGKAKLYKKKSTRSKVLQKLDSGAEMTRISTSGAWSQVVIKKGGKTGWVKTKAVENLYNITDQVTRNRAVTRNGITLTASGDQFFRVKTVEVDTEQALVTVTATQVFYDLHGNLVNIEWEANGESADAALTYMQAHLLHGLGDFDIVNYDTSPSSTVTGDYSYKSIVEFLLDPDDGLIPQTQDMLIRDGWDIYVLPGDDRDTGVTIRRGKNLIGVTTSTDVTDLVTRILPVGKAKNGAPLYLTGSPYVDSPHIADYPNIYAKRIEYPVSIVEKDPDNVKTFTNVTTARNKLRSLAQKDLSGGCDLADYSLDVDFALLQYAEGYEDYAALQSVHLYDTVTVIDELIGLSAKIRVVEYEWDCLTRQYTKLTLGNLQSIKPTVYSYNMPNGGISGSKIAVNSITGRQLGPDSIYTRNLRAGVVTADNMATDTFTANTAIVQALNAQSVTATAAAIHDITAADITTNALYTGIAHAMSLAADSIAAGDVTTDQLAAQIARAASLTAAIVDVGYARIKDLDAGTAIIQDGLAGALTIERLAVTSANLLNAIIGNLILPGTDGEYYALRVGAGGSLETEALELTPEEIEAGESADGRPIVADAINAQTISGSTVMAQEAILSEVMASAIEASQITAVEATLATASIPALYTTAIAALGSSIDISANDSIELILDRLGRYFTFGEKGLEICVKDDEGRHASAWWTQIDEQGYHINHDAVAGHVGSFTGNLLRIRGAQLTDGASTDGIAARPTASGGWVWTD